MSELPQRLRTATLEVRRQKIPIGNLIPMMQQAADRIEADEALMRQALQALETGHDCSIEVANDVHEKYKGYKPQRHAAVDMDVSQIDAAITALRSRLETK